MNITNLVLVAALLAAIVWIYLLDRRIDKLMDRITAISLDESEFRNELKREMSKLHDYCDGNAKSLLLTSRSLDAMKLDFAEMRNDMATLEEKQKEFDELAGESVRAQIESEKAWAEGVRAITSFGADIPALNLKGIEK